MAVDLDRNGKVLGLELLPPQEIKEEVKAQIMKSL